MAVACLIAGTLSGPVLAQSETVQRGSYVSTLNELILIKKIKWERRIAVFLVNDDGLFRGGWRSIWRTVKRILSRPS